MNEKRITNPDHTSPRRTLNVYHLPFVLLLLETTWVVPTSVVQCTRRSTGEVLVEYDPVIVGYTTHHFYRITLVFLPIGGIDSQLKLSCKVTAEGGNASCASRARPDSNFLSLLLSPELETSLDTAARRQCDTKHCCKATFQRH